MNNTLLKVVDQSGYEVTFPFPPQRIVSLVPSQTELLFDLGLEEHVRGITKFCVHPRHWLTTKTVIGGTKNFWFEVIDQIKPDLIVGNKEENYKEGILKLREKYPVWISDIISLDDSLSAIKSIGEITGTSDKAISITRQIQNSFSQLKKFESKSVLYMIWRNPWMAVGNNTFIHTMLSMMGLKNCLEEKNRYPELHASEIKALAPEVIFLSSEPFPFQEKHIEELQQICPNARIMLVDGEMFSWYGSRLVQAPAYFNSLDI
jgi:ABC-type Fe3+-hydroxamate transport system substrate-binding protein